MTNSPGACIEQYDAEPGKALWYAGIFAVVTAGFAVHGRVPYGLLHLMGIVGSIVYVLFALAQLLPGSCCLRVYEKGIVIRTLFVSHFIAWSSINGFSVTPQFQGPRVTLSLDPSLGIGRQFPLYFTYKLSPELLADKLTTIKARYSDETVTQLEHGR